MLGGATLVVPAGTVVRKPTAPGSLDFMGYNALSVKATVAGLGGADRLTIGIDTLDPESAAGAVLAGSLGRVDIVTAAANGNVAGMIHLPDSLQGVIFGRPNSDVSVQFGRFGAATNYQCVNQVVSDGGTTYVAYNSFPNAALLDNYGGTAFNFTGPKTGFKLRIVQGKFLGDAATRTWEGRLRIENTVGAAITANHDYVSGGIDAYETRTFTLVDADCVAVAAAAAGAGYRFINIMGYGGGGIPTSEWRCTQLELQVGQNGLSALATPFYRNTLVLDASGSAVDVTVSALLLELTNA